MSKQIKFKYEGIDYVLEYNRESISLIESKGFTLSEFTAKPMLMLPLAFSGLFLKNHKRTKQSTVDNIYDSFKDKEKLVGVIVDMLSEAYDTLTDNEGNIEWEIVG